MIVTADELIALHRTLAQVEVFGVAPEERELLTALEAGEVFVPTMSELAAYFGVSSTAFIYWRDHDPAGVLRKAPFNVKGAERVRHRMLNATGGRARLCQGDLYPATRRRALRILACAL